jgi:DNA-binding SARP family transcriptional activator
LGAAAIEIHAGPRTDAPTPTPEIRPVKLETRTTEALLLYLACRGRAVSRDDLAELLWPERTQAQARANLRLALHRLRRQIDPFLLVTRQIVGLNPSAAIHVDVADFERHLAHRQLEAAIALYRGDFLDGFYLDDSPAFEQ